MWKILFIFSLLPSLVSAIPNSPVGLTSGDPTWTLDGTLQDIIYDDEVEGWLVDPYLGNFLTKSIWYGGPRLEVGGMHVQVNCTQGDGAMYCAFGPDGTRNLNIVEVDDKTGEARLLMHWTGVYVGDTEDVQGGIPFYNDYDSTLYLTGPSCLRKVVYDGDGTRSVELVAGECGTKASTDGIGAAARFQTIVGGQAALTDGTMYLLEQNALRKVTPAGVVTTPTFTRPETPARLWTIPEYSHVGFLSAGADANTLYLADSLNENIAEIDLTTNVITRIAGVIPGSDDYSRRGTKADGPALTFASGAGGTYVAYSPFYDRVFYDSYDALSIRWVTPDAWVKTILLSPRPGTKRASYSMEIAQTTEGIGGESAYVNSFISSPIANINGVDDRGGVYIKYSRDLNGIFRAYNPMKGGTQ